MRDEEIRALELECARMKLELAETKLQALKTEARLEEERDTLKEQLEDKAQELQSAEHGSEVRQKLLDAFWCCIRENGDKALRDAVEASKTKVWRSLDTEEEAAAIRKEWPLASANKKQALLEAFAEHPDHHPNALAAVLEAEYGDKAP